MTTREALESARSMLTLCAGGLLSDKQGVDGVYKIIDQCSAALTSLDAPFDISKVEGWKAMFVDEVWRFATPEHRWELQLVMNWWWRIVQDDRIVFDGEIKTQSFFLALCEALNIEQK